MAVRWLRSLSKEGGRKKGRGGVGAVGGVGGGEIPHTVWKVVLPGWTPWDPYNGGQMEIREFSSLSPSTGERREREKAERERERRESSPSPSFSLSSLFSLSPSTDIRLSFCRGFSKSSGPNLGFRGWGGEGGGRRGLATGRGESGKEGEEEGEGEGEGHMDSPKELKEVEANQYMILRDDSPPGKKQKESFPQKQFFAEGTPLGLSQEFEATGCGGILIREQAKDLIKRIETVLENLKKKEGELEDPDSQSSQGEKEASVPVRSHFLLEGLRGSGKTVALATLVLWARANDWLVFYVPSGREWTYGGVYYKHQGVSLWDTPFQARKVLEGFLASHENILARLPIRVTEPLSLGEGPGTGPPRGAIEIVPREEWTLKDLVSLGISNWNAAVSVVVRLREELAQVTEVPVMIAIDEYNSWFTLSQYGESIGERSRRFIHANELRMVNAFRPMAGEGVKKLENGLVVAAVSESIGVGKMPSQLPGVPRRVRFSVPRYSQEEAMAAMTFYRSLMKVKRETPTEEMRKLFFLTAGNAAEIRKMRYLIL